MGSPGGISWTDLYAWIRYQAGQAGDSAIYRSVNGHNWTDDRALQAAIFDALHAANWQRGARRGTARPKPWPRPKALETEAAAGTKTIGKASAPSTDITRILELHNGR